jgi:8-oxo-dGTP pyrophosphatase MutT (NUDIX family)
VTGLPKGGANHGETGEQAAGREVREETGINVVVRERLGDVRYWYRRQGRRIQKTVHFYLCEFVSGSTDDHDHEVDDARWIPAVEAATALSYPGERQLVEQALSKVRPDR